LGVGVARYAVRINLERLNQKKYEFKQRGFLMFRILVLLLLITGCGFEKNETSDLDIVGGKQTYRRWFGLLEVGGGGRCGVSLIAPNWVITARHCLPSLHRDKIKIRLGAYNSNRNNGGRSFDLIKVSKIVEHRSHDLALLKLDKKSKFKPIGFREGAKFPEGYKLHAFGFGNVGWGVPGKGITLGVALKHRLVKKPKKHIIYTDGSEGLGICHGDSGGPLIDPKTRKLVGVTAWTGSHCASQRGVDGFVRPDVDWIKRVVEKKK